MIVAALVLAYPDFGRDFILETDASINGLGTVLSQAQEDGKVHPVAYASRALSPTEELHHYGAGDPGSGMGCYPLHYYLYGHNIKIFTDHTAVKAVLGAPQSNGKHARWWSKVSGSGIKAVEIVYCSGKENTNADALSRQPYLDAPSQDIAKSEVQVAAVRDAQPVPLTGGELLQQEPPLLEPEASQLHSYAVEQRKDPSLLALIEYLTERNLPEDPQESRSVAFKAVNFTIIDDVLYRVDPQATQPPTDCSACTLSERCPGAIPWRQDGWTFFWTPSFQGCGVHLVVGGPVQRRHGSCQVIPTVCLRSRHRESAEASLAVHSCAVTFPDSGS